MCVSSSTGRDFNNFVPRNLGKEVGISSSRASSFSGGANAAYLYSASISESLRQSPHYTGDIIKRRLFVFVRTENIFKPELFENDDVTIIMWFPCPSFPSLLRSRYWGRQEEALRDDPNRDLKQRRRRRQGRRLEKNEFIFYRQISQMPRSAQCLYRSQNLLKLNMQCQRSIPKENTKNKPPSLTFIPRTWSFSRCCFAEDGEEMYQEL